VSKLGEGPLIRNELVQVADDISSIGRGSRRRPVVHRSASAVGLRGPRDRDQAKPSVPQVVLYCLSSLLGARLCVISPWDVTLKLYCQLSL
jgi:hypothetical protein